MLRLIHAVHVLGGLRLQLAIRQLILGKVLAHFVQSVDRPQRQFGHFDPPVVHSFRVHDHDDQMECLLFKRGGEAGAGCRRYTRFEAVEALAQ